MVSISKKTAAIGTGTIGGATAIGVTVSELTKEGISIKEKLLLVEEKFKFNWDKEGCSESINRSFNDKNYKEAVIACSSFSTLSEIAENLGLDVVKEDNKGNSWLAWWDDNSSKIKPIVGGNIGDKKWIEITTTQSGSTKTTNITYPVGDIVIKWCKEQNLTNETTADDWHKFLIACTKNGKKSLVIIDDKDFQNEKEEKVEGPIKHEYTVRTTKTSERNKHLGVDFWTNEEKIEWKINSASFEFETNKTEDCQKKLKEKFDNYGENYQAAVKACLGSKTYKNRAKQLGFKVVPQEGEDDKYWSSLWDHKEIGWKEGEPKKLGTQEELKERISTTIGTTVNKTSNWSAVKSTIQSYCANTENNKTYEKADEASWQKYLKACTKNKSIFKRINDQEKAISFWTGEYTETASN